MRDHADELCDLSDTAPGDFESAMFPFLVVYQMSILSARFTPLQNWARRSSGRNITIGLRMNIEGLL